ncbi:hypothetical protein HMPREF9963_0508 [Streptococcus dysgalactiae subsp. equisimilis SK1250]|nr:hypothetical protein HMPREF9963_0508 [Streptococcus dysgalactiae subsp. equisimilis SK1250]
MQQVFNVSVPVPDDVVIISKEEYLDLLSDNEQGKWWDIENLQELLGIGRSKLINDILLNPEIKKKWIYQLIQMVLLFILGGKVAVIKY